MDEPTASSLDQALANLEPGSHLGWFYASERDHKAVITAFLAHALKRREKAVYIVDQHPPSTIAGYLWEAGIEAGQYLASEQLTLLSVQGTYMHERVFSPEAMLARLRRETEQTVAAGYRGLRVTGEMTWALEGYPGSEQLIEYEAKVNDLFEHLPCIGLCQYDVRRFAPGLLLEAMRTHPLILVGTELHRNPHYSPHGPFQDAEAAQAQLRAWLDHLTASSASRN